MNSPADEAGNAGRTLTGHEFGAKLRRRRKELGLTQVELGGTRLSKGYISLIETGKVNPSEEAMAYLAARLRKPVSYFGGGLEDSAGMLRSHLAEGQAHLRRGETDLAGGAFKQAARLAMDTADELDLARVHENVGHLYLVLGDLPAAVFAYREALSLYRQAGNTDGAAACHCSLIGASLAQGHTEAAESEYSAVMMLLASENYPNALTTGRAHLGGGYAALVRGCSGEARRRLEAALSAFGGNDLAGAGETHYALGLFAMEAGDWPAARLHLERASGLLDSVAAPELVAAVLRHLAETLVQQGQHERAVATVRRLGAASAACGDDRGLAWAMSVLAEVTAHLGDLATASQALAEADLVLAQRQGDAGAAWVTLLRARVARVTALVSLRQGQAQQALQHFSTGLALAEQAADGLALRFRLLTEMGQLHSQLGDADSALECCRKLLAVAQSALPALGRPSDYTQLWRILSALWFRT